MRLFGLRLKGREIASPEAETVAEVAFASVETNVLPNYTNLRQCALARERRSINQREP
jgi:hypothetical protein